MRRLCSLLVVLLVSGLLISGCAYEDYLSSDSSDVKTSSVETNAATEEEKTVDTTPKYEEKTISVYTTSAELNIRSGVGTSNEVIYVAQSGERLEMTGSEGKSGSGATWYEVITPNGVGWCSGNYGTVSEETVTVEIGTGATALITKGADLETVLIGTYKGADGSVLTFLPDGTADYYFKSDSRGVLQGQAWSITENRITWKYDGQYDIYADVKGGDVSNLTFIGDESVWTEEQYIKVSNEAAHWTIEECNAFLDSNASATGEASMADNSTLYTSVDYETAKKGNEGVFAYRSRGGSYYRYYIIDFDEGYVYYFMEGNGDESCEKVKIVSGNLNDVVIITYHDGNDKWSYGLHFKWKKQPDHLVVQDNDGFTDDYYETDLSDALAIRDRRMIIEY